MPMHCIDTIIFIIICGVIYGTCDIFSFLFDSSTHEKRYILMKTPPESDQWFQSYSKMKNSHKNRKQKKYVPFSGCISQSMLSTNYTRSQHILS